MRAWQAAARSGRRFVTVRWPAHRTLQRPLNSCHFALDAHALPPYEHEATLAVPGEGQRPVSASVSVSTSSEQAVDVTWFGDKISAERRRQADAQTDDISPAWIEGIGDELLSQHRRGRNLLHDLATQHGRWSDVVWVARQLLASSSDPSLMRPHDLHELVERTSVDSSLQRLTDRRADQTDPQPLMQQRGPRSPLKIDTILDGQTQREWQEGYARRHSVLGVVWSAIGTLALACVHNEALAGGMIKSEVLEILALFHHHGFVSSDVYSYNHNAPSDAIQQPIVMHLLSSRIITALTDADWRARERLAIEQAETAGEDMSSVALELRGRSVRANIGALRPEIWIELILWSCLHGGWTSSGAEILDHLCQLPEDHAWTTLSWRKKVRQILPFGGTRAEDWDELKFQFDTRPLGSLAEGGLLGFSIERTISSEVVSAYVDVLASSTCRLRGRNAFSTQIVRPIYNLRGLLRRSKALLSYGSWGAVLQRLLDNGDFSFLNRRDVNALTGLSPTMGQEASASSDCDLPAYIFDGSAAILGLLHRSLRDQISASNMTGASKILKIIMKRVDDARRRSILDLFESNRTDPQAQHDRSLFTSNFPGIEYPVFDTQIPPSTIAFYIDLITSCGLFDLGRSLFLEQRDTDDTLLPRRIWGDANLAPALARFATAIDDKELLETIITARLHAADFAGQEDASLGHILSSVLSLYLASSQWRAAIQLMLTMQEKHNQKWDVKCFAVAARSILLIDSKDQPAASSSAIETGSNTQWSVFEAMTADIESNGLGRRPEQHRSARLFSILAVLSTIDQRFLDILRRTTDTRSFYCPPTNDFDVVLSAVAESKGRAAAQKLVEDLTHYRKHDSGHKHDLSKAATGSKELHTRWFKVPAADGSSLTARTTLTPSFTSIRIILKQALREWDVMQQNPASSHAAHPRAIYRWALRTMFVVARQEQHMVRSAIRQELEDMARSLGMSKLIDDAPEEHVIPSLILSSQRGSAKIRRQALA